MCEQTATGVHPEKGSAGQKSVQNFPQSMTLSFYGNALLVSVSVMTCSPSVNVYPRQQGRLFGEVWRQFNIFCLQQVPLPGPGDNATLHTPVPGLSSPQVSEILQKHDKLNCFGTMCGLFESRAKFERFCAQNSHMKPIFRPRGRNGRIHGVLSVSSSSLWRTCSPRWGS